MYRLLIVDDEIEVAEYFHRIFTLEAHLPIEVYTAYSAIEALECLNHIRIDVVLSDIKMPQMTGIQMYEIIKERWARCRVIFLSGVMDFDYVYQSIQAGDVRYLTKLEPVEKIIETVKITIDEIEAAYVAQTDIQKIQEQLKQALPLLQGQFLAKLLNGTPHNPESLQKELEELKLNFDINSPILLIIGKLEGENKSNNIIEQERAGCLIKSFAEQYLCERYNLACYASEQNYFVWFLQDKGETSSQISDNAFLNGQIEYIQAACFKALQLSIGFGYSNTPFSFFDISEEFIRIKTSLGYQRILSEGSSELSKEDNPTEEFALQNCTENTADRHMLIHLNMLESYLEFGQKKEFFELFGEMTKSLSAVESRNYGPALEIYYSLATMFMKHINTYKLTEKLAFKLALYKLMRADEHESWGFAVSYLNELALMIFHLHFDSVERLVADAVVQVQKYIGENLGGDLTLVSLSDIVKLNPSYFSRLFKEKVSINLYDYILERRMAKAKEMLKCSSERIQTIACAVGYESAQSFTRTFKKAVGLSPSEYRDDKEKSELL